jgi:glycosyltransferase involved in cell wall biosynthesis
MKITFVLPWLNVSGGIRVILDYAVRLHARGHDVRLVSLLERPPSLKARLAGWLRDRQAQRPPSQRRDALREFGAGHLPHRAVLEEEVKAAVSPSDVVIATWWYTAELVNDLPAQVGTKVYFIQGDESSLPFLPRERVIATLAAPLHKVAVSDWVASAIRGHVGDVAVTVIANGVDVAKFHAPARPRNPIPRVGFVYSAVKVKGCDIILAALARLRAQIPDLRVVAFGSESVSPTLPVPAWVELTEKPTQDELVRCYAGCDLWLWGSRAEGFGLPILEAMACRTPVVATRAGAAPQLLAGGGGTLVPCDDAPAMAVAAREVLEASNEAWQSLSDAAWAVAQANRCETAAEHFERYLQGLGLPPPQ